MSVGSQLGLDDDSELLAQVRLRWPVWTAEDSRLAVVSEFDDLRGWLSSASRNAADDVLLALAMLAAPDGGDDAAAAAALAKCLLPGACRIASSLTSLPSRDVLRDSQPVGLGARSTFERIDELVASQLWIEVRTFPWRRLRKVAANILMNTRAGVLREIGEFVHVARVDPTWARTTPVESLAFGEGEAESQLRGAVAALTLQAAAALEERAQAHADDGGPGAREPSPAEELWDLLTWACETQVISAADCRLLLCLVEEADRVETRNLRRGCGGLLGNELSLRVAPRFGVSQATVRRHASRTMRAIAAAAPRRFSDVG